MTNILNEENNNIIYGFISTEHQCADAKNIPSPLL